MSTKETEASDCMQPIRKRVQAMVKQLEVLKANFSSANLERYDEAELSVRLEYIEQVNKTFNEAQSKLEEDFDAEIDISERMNFTSLYFDVKAAVARQRHKMFLSNPSSTLRQFSFDEPQRGSRKSKVPEIQLPKFGGNYLDWPNFFGLFSTLIDDNNELTDLEKFHYLRTCLYDAALATISSLELNCTNYREAISILKNRFDNKILHFQTHIVEIFALKALRNGSAIGLRNLSDKINSHLRALKSMASIEEIADGLLIHVVVSKMDDATQIKWEEGLATDEFPKWSSLSSFLVQRCRMLENLENSMLQKSTKQQVLQKSGHHERFVHVSSSNGSISCTFCDSQEHLITNCSVFSNLSPLLRFQEAKRLRLCLNCLRKGHMLNKCPSGNCRKCSSKHHTMLHMEPIVSSQSLTQTTDLQSLENASAVLVSSSKEAAVFESEASGIFLATAVILVKDQSGLYVPCRAILDSASQVNLINCQLLNRLGLKCNRTSLTISGIGDGDVLIHKSTTLEVKSCNSEYFTSFNAMVVPTITNYQPIINKTNADWKIPENIHLADPFFNECRRVDVLIGAELFFELMAVGQIKLGKNLPILQKTLFGWVIAGGGSKHTPSCSLSISVTKTEEALLSSILKSFWEIENNISPGLSLTTEDQFCEQHFAANTTRLASGAYSVRLPQVESLGASSLGNSYQCALQRFKGLERKFSRNPEIKLQYSAFMSEYLSLNHMSLVSSQDSQMQYFLPHHCVHKLDSTTTKLRVVFDGSAKTSTGLALNDILYSGPTIQHKLFNTLLRYRTFKIALSGDICKMYRCVRISHPDDYLQCILWRENPFEEIKTYKLNTVTYGTKPAAFLAIRAMHQLASDEETNYPLGAKILRRDFYVDDMISGGGSVDEVVLIQEEVSAILLKGGFVIRKWCSNDQTILKGLPADQCEQFLKFHDGTDVTKTLGLVWDPKNDNFIFSFTPPGNEIVTKRSILSSIARLYDPLGLIGPVITKAKIFMQQLWKLDLNWDESLPQHLHTSWLDYISKFESIPKLTFPRFVSMQSAKVQIHAFCDASLAAYGACIYVRSEINNFVKVLLLCSKSRVSPLKTLTVPKLELAAACILAELIDSVSKTLPYNCSLYCWSDSMVVLSWIREQPSNFNAFVSNRVTRIQNLTHQMSWRYVPTNKNPADILSRGATPEELMNSSIWKNGPEFLYFNAEKWPNNMEFKTELPERRRNVFVMTSIVDLSIQCKYHNSFPKMQRIFAYVFKFLHFKLSSFQAHLDLCDIQSGTRILIKNIQLVHFATEHKSLKDNKDVPTSSKLYCLRPILDPSGLIRVGGRLQFSNLSFDAQHPIILPKNHPFTTALVMYFHQRLLHAGPQCLLASIRQEYWPIGGRKHVTSIISKCLRCFRMKPILKQHVMGSLPAARVTPSKVFYTTGIDFCGPFFYKSEVRTRQPLKCYISIFVCFTTKASHLEIVRDLSTNSFLSALKRFIAIRGRPKTIWSDNATNFVGAKNELAELKQLFMSQQHNDIMHRKCLEEGIEWKFIPPRSPHFGGLWEAAVKIAKYHFYRTVGVHILEYDDLHTLTCQISAIMNSRPLCPISEDPDDLDVLTPGHFLTGGPLSFITEPNIADIKLNRLNKWQLICQMQQTFWKKWSNSYLTLLQERFKWRASTENIAVGAMVLLKDENAPSLKWQMGRIIDVIPGEDGVIRVVLVRTSNGIIKRAVAKLAVLPIETSVGDPCSPTGGVCL